MSLLGRAKVTSALTAGSFALTVSGGSAFAQWQVGYLHTDGTVRKSQRDSLNDAEAEAQVICIAAAGVADGASGLFRGPGLIPGIGGTPGDAAFVGETPGTLSNAAPAVGSGQWLTRCGRYTAAGDLLFTPATPVGM